MPWAQLAYFLDAGGNRLRDNLEISELRAAWRRVDWRVLFGGDGQQPPAGRYRHKDDPHRPGYAQHDRIQGHFGRARSEHISRARESAAERAWRPQLHSMRFAADGQRVRRAH